MSDGTSAGTRQPRTFGSEARGSGAQEIVDLDGNGRVVFTAFEPTTGLEVFVSDGTTRGTNLLRDVRPGSSGSDPRGLFRVGNRVFFSADDGVNGSELWVTDGTGTGTRAVVDLNAGAASGLFGNAGTEINGRALFVATDGTAPGLWTSDGTPAGTRRIHSFPGVTGEISTITVPSVTTPNRAWVISSVQGNTFAITWTDGTAAGTADVVDSANLPGFRATSAAELGNELVFNSLFDLFKTGRVRGPTSLAQLTSSGQQPSQLVSTGSRIVFTTGTPSSGILWSTDGTAAGTMALSIFLPTPVTNIIGLRPLFGNQVAFSANDLITGSEPWITDGTIAGTRQLADLDPGAGGSGTAFWTELNSGDVIFAASLRGFGPEPWISGPAFTNPRLLRNTVPDPPLDSAPGAKVVLRDEMYFAATTANDGTELWVSDGTAAGTSLLHNVAQGPFSSSPQDLTAANGSLFFTTGSSNSTLWRSSGRRAGQAAATLDRVWSGSADLRNATAFAGDLWFHGRAANDTVFRLWRSDGTSAGTRVAFPSLDTSHRIALLVLESNGRMFFAADDGMSGTELWSTDGSPNGTARVADIDPGTGSSLPVPLCASTDRIFMTATTGLGSELWVTDGTATGTRLVADIASGPNSSDPNDGVLVEGRLWFSAETPTTGRELWSSDGTAAGTRLEVELVPGGGSPTPRPIGAINGKLLVGTRLQTPNTGYAGSTGSFTLFAVDLATGSVEEIPGATPFEHRPGLQAQLIGNRYLFSATDGSGLADELYVTDGTAAGTRLVANLNPAGFGVPEHFVRLHNRVFFTATDNIHGRELWQLDTRDLDIALADRYGEGCDFQANRLRPTVSALPALGTNPTVSLLDGASNAASAMLIGARRADVAIGNGCSLLVDALLTQIPLRTDAAGSARFALPISFDPVLLDFELNLQPVVLDPAGPWFGLANFGSGISLVVGQP